MRAGWCHHLLGAHSGQWIMRTCVSSSSGNRRPLIAFCGRGSVVWCHVCHFLCVSAWVWVLTFSTHIHTDVTWYWCKHFMPSKGFVSRPGAVAANVIILSEVMTFSTSLNSCPEVVLSIALTNYAQLNARMVMRSRQFSDTLHRIRAVVARLSILRLFPPLSTFSFHFSSWSI